MGSAARGYRADRFIDAFDEFAQKAAGIEVGASVEVTRVFLGQSESDECVRAIVQMKLPDGRYEHLELATTLYDPEYTPSGGEDDWLPDHFGITREEYEARLKSADLWD